MTTSRLVGGAEVQNKLVPLQHVVVENLEKYLGYRGTPRRLRGPGLTQGSSVRNSSARKRSPHNFKW